MDSLGGILTGGLGGNCTAMIIGPFRLKVLVSVHNPSPYINTHEEEIEHEPRKLVTISVVIGKYSVEREYTVTKNRSGKIVKVTNFINSTLNNISIKITNFKSRIKNITV